MTSPRLDSTGDAARRDAQTVTKEGVQLGSRIDGVVTGSPVNHVDHRGRVFEVYAGPSDFWQAPVVYCYAFTVRAGQVKGWGLHLEKEDRYTLIHGEVLTVLYDARVDSPTYGVVQKVTLSEQGIRMLRIPTGVWHMNVNLAETETFLINHPTVAYHHSAPDRLLLPWDAPEIPVDLASFFPIQARHRHDCGGHEPAGGSLAAATP
ncbi:MAG TPA: dTDP-4-dehydrorhamnose 3,5-epimerase family protein [Actinotalea sp.]|nr:dTDP-4-dehydrorhamnose 3,5-epimerase family protein [Actinotalea sp.]